MKKLFVFLFLISALNVNAQAPDWQWAKNGGGIFLDRGTAITVDASGNTIATGFYEDPNVGGPSGDYECGFGTDTIPCVDRSDVFIVKYDPSGNVLWLRGAGGTGIDKSTAITTDPSGNIYVTGNFTSPTMTFDTVSISRTGAADIFVAKYDAVGNILWAKAYGNVSGSFAYGIAADVSGNIVITGYFNGATFVLDATTLTNSYSSFGGYLFFIARLDPSGLPVWAKQNISGSLCAGNGIALDASGNSFVTGYYTSTSVFDTITSPASLGGREIFVIKYDVNGNPIWLKGSGGNYNDEGLGIAIDASGNIYISGSFKSNSMVMGSTTLSNTGVPDPDALIAKYSPSGSIIWAKDAASYGPDVANGVAVDGSGNSYITGNFDNSLIIFGGITLNGSGASSSGELFVVKYDPSGTALWGKNILSSASWGAGIAVDAAGSARVTGYFGDPTINCDGIIVNGQNDAFTGRINISSTVGIGSNVADEILNIYPNPSNGLFSIKGAKGMKLEVFNSLSQLVLNIENNSDEFQLDLSTVPSGIYFLKCTGNGKQITKKLLKK